MVERGEIQMTRKKEKPMFAGATLIDAQKERNIKCVYEQEFQKRESTCL